MFLSSVCRLGGRDAKAKTREKSLVQDGDIDQQSHSGVRTPSEALSTRDGVGRRQRRRKTEAQGDC